MMKGPRCVKINNDYQSRSTRKLHKRKLEFTLIVSIFYSFYIYFNSFYNLNYYLFILIYLGIKNGFSWARSRLKNCNKLE